MDKCSDDQLRKCLKVEMGQTKKEDCGCKSVQTTGTKVVRYVCWTYLYYIDWKCGQIEKCTDVKALWFSTEYWD